MKQLVIAERICLATHIASMLFGLAGILIVLPNPDIIACLPPLGQTAFQWSMAGGGVAYILFGAATMLLYAYRTFGIRTTLGFLIPAVCISLCSELLGTRTGFPFGEYYYLSGLGYKIAGLVPFTIPLSWFYMGLSCYLLARAGLRIQVKAGWWRHLLALAMGAVLLTAWDLVLDPAMSQASLPFWQFDEVGKFFGMPYRNLSGWIGTGLLFMSIAAFLWRKTTLALSPVQLTVPLSIYLVNFLFGAAITIITLDQAFLLPTGLSILFGVIPAIVFWWTAPRSRETLENHFPHRVSLEESNTEINHSTVELQR